MNEGQPIFEPLTNASTSRGRPPPRRCKKPWNSLPNKRNGWPMRLASRCRASNQSPQATRTTLG